MNTIFLIRKVKEVGRFVVQHGLVFSMFVFFILFSFTVSVFATPPASTYNAGETLNPTCAPGSTNCAVGILPDQTGNSGMFLTTDGSVVSWGTVTQNTFSTGLTNTSGTVTNDLSTGIIGGQDIYGGVDAGDTLTLNSTTNATKGKIIFGISAYDEVNNRLGIGTTTPQVALDVTSFDDGVYGRFQARSGTYQAAFTFNNGPQEVWFFGKQTDDSFIVYDSVALKYKFRIVSNGAIRLGEDGTTNVTIGSTTTTSMFNVGTSAGFRVNSTGAVVAATGITSSGTINFSGLTASTALATDASKNLISSATTSTELGYLSGVTSAIQTQLNTKGTFTLPSLTTGSVLFSNGTTTAQDNTNLFWDDTTNRLGIGTTSPSAFVHVLGITEQLRLGYDASNYLSTTIGSTGSATLALTGTSPTFSFSQAVGIGGVTPSVNSYLSIPRAQTASTNYGLISIGNGAFDGATAGKFTGVSTGTVMAINLATGSAGHLADFQVGGAEKFSVNFDGLTTATSYRTSTGGFQFADSSAGYEWQLKSVNRLLTLKADHTNSAPSYSNTLMSFDNATLKVGIGVADTVVPSAKLHIISTTEQLRVGYNQTNYVSFTTGSTGSTTLALTGTSPTFNFSNNVGVSCADADHLLEIGGTGTGCNTGAGSYLNAAGDTTFTANSSRVWKDNITTVEKENILDLIASTPVRRYDWKPEYCDGPQCLNKIGFIAEEFYPVLEHGDNQHVNGQDVSMAEWLGLQKLIQVTSTMDLKIQNLNSLDVNTSGTFGYMVKTLLADTANTITDMYAKIVHADRVETNELCVGTTCITEAQFLQMVNQNNSNVTPAPPTPDPVPTTDPVPSNEPVNIAPNTEPVPAI